MLDLSKNWHLIPTEKYFFLLELAFLWNLIIFWRQDSQITVNGVKRFLNQHNYVSSSLRFSSIWELDRNVDAAAAPNFCKPMINTNVFIFDLRRKNFKIKYSEVHRTLKTVRSENKSWIWPTSIYNAGAFLVKSEFLLILRTYLAQVGSQVAFFLFLLQTSCYCLNLVYWS